MSIVAGGQTSYTIDIPAFTFPGQIADASFRDVISAIAIENVPYGVAVVDAGSSDFSRIRGRLPNAATDKILGIAIADQARAQRPEFTSPTYLAGEALGLVREGRIVVVSETDVALGDDVYIRYAGEGQLGALSNAEVANETVKLEGARFIDTKLAGELVVLELELI